MILHFGSALWFLLMFNYNALAQKESAEPLYKKLQSFSSSNDTAYINCINQIAQYWEFISVDSSQKYVNREIILAQKDNYEVGLANAYRIMGYLKAHATEYDSSIIYYEKARKICEQLNKLPGVASCLAGIARTYYLQSNFTLSLHFHLKALKISEQLDDKLTQSRELGNIGIVEEEIGEFDKAIEYMDRALLLDKETKNEEWYYQHQATIGTAYYRKSGVSKAKGDTAGADKLVKDALAALTLAYDYCERTGKKQQMAEHLLNIGNVYYYKGDIPKTVECYERALVVDKEVRNIHGIASNLCNIGWINYEEKNYEKAESYLNESIIYADSARSLNLLINVYENLSIVCEDSKQFKKSFTWYKKFINLRDSLFNLDKTTQLIKTEMKYNNEKKEALAKEEAEKQAVIRNIFIGGFVLMLALAIFIFRGYRNKKKANEIILHQKSEVQKQKELLDEKNREITASIRYAKRIQTSLLPTEKFMERQLNLLQNRT